MEVRDGPSRPPLVRGVLRHKRIPAATEPIISLLTKLRAIRQSHGILSIVIAKSIETKVARRLVDHIHVLLLGLSEIPATSSVIDNVTSTVEVLGGTHRACSSAVAPGEVWVGRGGCEWRWWKCWHPVALVIVGLGLEEVDEDVLSIVVCDLVEPEVLASCNSLVCRL